MFKVYNHLTLNKSCEKRIFYRKIKLFNFIILLKNSDDLPIFIFSNKYLMFARRDKEFFFLFFVFLILFCIVVIMKINSSSACDMHIFKYLFKLFSI